MARLIFRPYAQAVTHLQCLETLAPNQCWALAVEIKNPHEFLDLWPKMVLWCLHQKERPFLSPNHIDPNGIHDQMYRKCMNFLILPRNPAHGTARKGQVRKQSMIRFNSHLSTVSRICHLIDLSDKEIIGTLFSSCGRYIVLIWNEIEKCRLAMFAQCNKEITYFEVQNLTYYIESFWVSMLTDKVK